VGEAVYDSLRLRGSLGDNISHTAYPSQLPLSGFPFYFETCIRNNSGVTASYLMCASNQSTCTC
jgi:hypothetical protein